MFYFSSVLFETIVASNIFLDTSRMNIVKQISKDLERMSNDIASGNRFRMLFLGEPNSNISLFLKEILHASNITSDGFIIPCYIDYAAPENKNKCPSDLVYEALPWNIKAWWMSYRYRFKNEYTMQVLNRMIHDCGYCVFVGVDNLHLVYGHGWPAGGDILGDLRVLGNLDGDGMHCILTGDATIMDKLAYGMLDEDVAKDYPNYSPVCNLNYTKYWPIRVKAALREQLCPSLSE